MGRRHMGLLERNRSGVHGFIFLLLTSPARLSGSFYFTQGVMFLLHILQYFFMGGTDDARRYTDGLPRYGHMPVRGGPISDDG